MIKLRRDCLLMDKIEIKVSGSQKTLFMLLFFYHLFDIEYYVF